MRLKIIPLIKSGGVTIVAVDEEGLRITGGRMIDILPEGIVLRKCISSITGVKTDKDHKPMLIIP